jgi:hypothetical protein
MTRRTLDLARPASRVQCHVGWRIPLHPIPEVQWTLAPEYPQTAVTRLP